MNSEAQRKDGALTAINPGPDTVIPPSSGGDGLCTG